MSHLGDLSTVLADDEHGTWVDLPLDVRLRALAHVADCPSCRAEVDEQRRVKARVRLAAGAPTVQAMPAGLLDSLLRLPASPQQPPSSRPAPLPNPGPNPGTSPGPTPGSGRRGRYVAAAGIAASVVVGLGSGGSVLAGSAGAGAPSRVGPSPTPSTTGAATTSGTAFAQTVPVRLGVVPTPLTSRPFANAALSVVYRRP
jgi:hypothetical protein